jgi:hypothetical protein
MTPDDNLIDEALIEETLRSMSAWEPPAGFAETVAAHGRMLMYEQPVAPRWWSFAGVTRAVTAATTTAIAVYLAASFIGQAGSALNDVVAPSPQDMWSWVVAAYVFAAWFALRYRTSE